MWSVQVASPNYAEATNISIDYLKFHLPNIGP